MRSKIAQTLCASVTLGLYLQRKHSMAHSDREQLLRKIDRPICPHLQHLRQHQNFFLFLGSPMTYWPV